MNATVNVVDLKNKTLDDAVAAAFAPFGGGRALLKSSGDVYFKVNAIDFKPNVYTDPAVIGAAIRYFRAEGARNVFVLENCTQGNFTRLVFDITGIDRVCRAEGAQSVCLDETGAAPVWLPHIEAFVDISSFVHDKLVRERDANLYVNIPVLKTHSMSQVTIGVKNQFGFVHQSSRIPDHNFKLHRKLADLYHVIRPDFTLVDAQKATNHGHYNAERFADECVLPMDLLIAGSDTLAVDVVGAHLMGYSVDAVEHLRFVKEDGLGCGDLDAIEILNRDLVAQRRRDLTHELLDRFPAGVKIIRGRERCCTEGCRRNTECALEVFANDYGCRHDFTIIMGKGVPPEQLAAVNGPVLLAGGCAVEECKAVLTQKLGPNRVFASPGCNQLAATCSALMSLMGVSAIKVARTNPLRALALLLSSRRHGSKALVTSIFPSKVRR